MTEQEAINELRKVRPRGVIIPQKQAEAIDMAIESLKKQSIFEQIKWERDVVLEQLEEIGVGLGRKMDDVKLAMEKQIPKKPLYSVVNRDDAVHCSACGEFACFRDAYRYNYCPKCGQAIDWSETELDE